MPQSPARRTRLLAAVPLVAAATFGLVPATASADTPPYGTSSNDTPAPCASGTTGCPTGDAFYAAPSGLAALAPGDVVRSRAATVSINLPSLKSAVTVLYRSGDPFDAPVADSGTILLPNVPWQGSGPQPIVSWQFPEDSVGAQCRPSYDLAHPGTNSNVDAEQSSVNALLAQGVIVEAPDFEGPAEMYEVGPQSGQAVLDGIRAAERYLKVPAATTPVELNGYSGGAFATGWGAELAASYAPELDIVGASMGGTPADQAVTGKYLDGTAFSGLALLTSIALDRAYPALDIKGYLNAAGQQLYDQNQGSCVGAATTYAYKSFDTYTTKPDFIDTPAIAATLRHDDLGQHPPAFPVFNYHVVNDEIVPYDQDQTLIKTYCAAGTPVEHLPLTGDHISGEALGAPAMLSFVQARFQGAPFVDQCAEISAAPLVPQVPQVTANGGGVGTNLPEVPAVALMGLLGAAALVLVARRRATRE